MQFVKKLTKGRDNQQVQTTDRGPTDGASTSMDTIDDQLDKFEKGLFCKVSHQNVGPQGPLVPWSLFDRQVVC